MCGCCCGHSRDKENNVKDHTTKRLDEILEEIKQMQEAAYHRGPLIRNMQKVTR
jgi:hypothetical protein